MVRPIPVHLARILQALLIPVKAEVIVLGIAVLHGQLDRAAVTHLVGAVILHPRLISVGSEPVAAAQHQRVRLDKPLARSQQHIL